MRALDIVVHASTDPEPFGLVIAEAMACGKAVVVSRAGGAVGTDRAGCQRARLRARRCRRAGALHRSSSPATRACDNGSAPPGDPPRSGRFSRRRMASELTPIYQSVAAAALMRVLHITSGNMYGGVETFLATLARESAVAPEMESEFAVCFEGRCSQELESLGHRSASCSGRVRLSRPHTLIRARRALAALLRRRPLRRRRLSPAVAVRRVRRLLPGEREPPWSLWVHMAGEGRHWLERLARRVRPDLAICNSQFSASRLSRWLSDAQVEQVYYPVSSPQASTTHNDRAALRRALTTPDRTWSSCR